MYFINFLRVSVGAKIYSRFARFQLQPPGLATSRCCMSYVRSNWTALPCRPTIEHWYDSVVVVVVVVALSRG